MKSEELIPPPTHRCPFRLKHQGRVPQASGCYALCNQDGTILYVGLSRNLYRRFEEHWESLEKRSLSESGRAVWFDWLVIEQYESIERGWMNAHLAHAGTLPVFNKIFSPMGI